MYQKISGSEKIYASERGQGLSNFSVENFLSHSAENFRRGESFSVSLISGIKKFYVSEGYVTIFDFLSKISCLRVPKNFVEEPFCVSGNLWYRKMLGIRGGKGGRITTSVEKFLSHSAETFRRGGESFNVSLISGIEKVWIRGGGGSIKILRRKIFCLTVPKNFIGEPFSVSLISGTEKVWIRGGGEYQDFPSKIFCLTVPKIFAGEPFRVSLISSINKC